MTGEMKTSAVNYAATLKPAVSFACMLSGADELRKQIANGKIEGISFPDQGKKKGGKEFKTSREDRLAKVQEVNAVRKSGVNASEAARRCNISYQTYKHWSNDLGVDSTFYSRWAVK